MAKWQPPIPAGAFCSPAAIQISFALPLLGWCYDQVGRDGWLPLNLREVSDDLNVPYHTIKKWWNALRSSEFVAEVEDRRRGGLKVRLADEWIDWRILSARPTREIDPDMARLSKQPENKEENRTNIDPDMARLSKQPENKEENRTNIDPDMARKNLHVRSHDDQESKGMSLRAKSAREPPAKQSEEATPRIVREALAEVCGVDLDVSSKEAIINVNKTAKRLYEAGCKHSRTPEETVEAIRYVAKWFAKNDWRGKKGDLPTPKNLTDVWGAAIAERAERKAPTAPPAAAARRPNAVPALELAKLVVANRKDRA